MFAKKPSPAERAETAIALCSERLDELRQQETAALVEAAKTSDLTAVEVLRTQIKDEEARRRTWLDVKAAAEADARQKLAEQRAALRRTKHNQAAKDFGQLDRRIEAVENAADRFLKVEIANLIAQAERVHKHLMPWPGSGAIASHFTAAGILRLTLIELHRLAQAAELPGFPIDGEALKGAFDYQRGEWRSTREHVELLHKSVDALIDGASDDVVAALDAAASPPEA